MNKVFLHIGARAGSQGLKNKNIKFFLGKPLIKWSIDFAKQMKNIDQIIINSDSKKILEISKKSGVNILLKRPKKISNSKSSKLSAWKFAVNYLLNKKLIDRDDIFVDLDCTCPLRSIKDVNRMINYYKFLKKRKKTFDGVYTITDSKKTPYFNLVEVNKSGFLKVSKKGKNNLVRRQDSPKVYEHVPNTYVLNPNFIIKSKNFMNGKFIGFKVDKYYSWDIDSGFDFKIAEFLLKSKKRYV